MVALAAWLLLMVLLGACGGCAGLGDRIHEKLVDVTRHPEQEALVLYEAGRFTEAEVYAREALERAEDPYFPEGSTLDLLARGLSLGSPGLAASLNTLALIYLGQGRYAEAEPLLERALAIREQGLGLAHPDPASISTTWQSLTGARAGTWRPSRSSSVPWRSRRRLLARTTPRWPRSLPTWQ